MNRQPVLILLLTLAALSWSACQSPERTAYRASKTAHITATAALKAWGDYVTAHKPPVDQERKVQKAFDTYKAAQLTLLDATKAYMEAGAQPPATAQERFEKALASAGSALSELIGLIQSFGGKI